jgi:hypothetical protein
VAIPFSFTPIPQIPVAYPSVTCASQPLPVPVRPALPSSQVMPCAPETTPSPKLVAAAPRESSLAPPPAPAQNGKIRQCTMNPVPKADTHFVTFRRDRHHTPVVGTLAKSGTKNNSHPVNERFRRHFSPFSPRCRSTHRSPLSHLLARLSKFRVSHERAHPARPKRLPFDTFRRLRHPTAKAPPTLESPPSLASRAAEPC